MQKRFVVGALVCALWSVPAWAQVKIDEPWARATVPGQKATGVFMKLTATQASSFGLDYTVSDSVTLSVN